MLEVEVRVLPATTDVIVFFGPVAGPKPMLAFEPESFIDAGDNTMCVVADEDDDDSGDVEGDGMGCRLSLLVDMAPT